jgi:hypothetical protein
VFAFWIPPNFEAAKAQFSNNGANSSWNDFLIAASGSGSEDSSSVNGLPSKEDAELVNSGCQSRYLIDSK